MAQSLRERLEIWVEVVEWLESILERKEEGIGDKRRRSICRQRTVNSSCQFS